MWLTLCALVMAGVVSAQTETSLKVGQPFTFMADHDGIETDRYDLFVNGLPHASLPVSALQQGTIAFPFPSGLPSKGNYLFVLTAVGPNGEGVSDMLTVPVSPGKQGKQKKPRGGQ